MPEKRIGHIIKINGNMVVAQIDSLIIQNEVAYIIHGAGRLKAEVIRVRMNNAEMQVYENTSGLKVGEEVEFTGELLSVELGPGLLGQIFDGLQNPLPLLAKKCGFFLKRGIYIDALRNEDEWDFSPLVKPGDKVLAGVKLGFVPEKIFKHYIMAPFNLKGSLEVLSVARAGKYNFKQAIAQLKDSSGKIHEVFLKQSWPVKIPISAYTEKLKPSEPLVTKMRLIDSLFPVACGGTYCIPGPFGAGKTVLQQLTSRHAEVDIVIIAACGERAGEVVETLKTFPDIIDPKTNKPLVDRTVIICNTSSMPVAARESSVYTAVTIAEYYRQMGLSVLLLADSTSRWAQAMREMSGRLEEIPGEEAFPAYLESRIASFYERAGVVRLHDGATGSVTIGGAISPAGGNFEEPVTQATLKVVGAFHGLSRERSDARRYPAIDPLLSWSKYKGFINEKQAEAGHYILHRSNEVFQMMKVIGEEGTSLKDYIDYLKGEFFDSVYLQQNAFDAVDEATSSERQAYVFNFIYNILELDFNLEDKEKALHFFQQLGQLMRTWNSYRFRTEEFKRLEEEIALLLEEKKVRGKVNA
ncbi:MAG: V-type ATP synthase subunit A [Candidatus Omnitrophica bacterium CG08_land_8_20_14_0_20_41_16]|uniref:V-type ATP synthase alpha chain n=1 Tax=Candidatus Sherwoodlollariibacterium unditelluris TaxID=1974757 RepID=A0A2G9YHJ2_9BACT|nr:MAG: V-type ATP synthase subunit A [Candidatus Omnitrophica bacterium CG23_combo_of_CG06-09_8_20_14_all_41_10]PIS34146.1 MAG: V-type ATP synthase subunit A [Candidatus Omnitrophica bacterium CG08_land_8_20_14_0_20_41_16]